MSVSDAVNGSSTGIEVPSMWALLRLPRFEGANHADGHDNRPRHRKVGFQIHGIDAAGNVIVRALSSATFCHSPSYRRCNKKLWIDRRCEQPSLTTLIHSQRAIRTKASHRCTATRGAYTVSTSE